MADETVLQTVKRNLTPELDTSKAALGPGGELTSGASPQAEGEQQYKEALGSSQEQAYGKLKNWLSEHEQHFSDKVLKPFRAGLDNMAEDLQTAGESGRTKNGGALNTVTRGLALGAGEALKAVPIGKDVKETTAGLALDFSHLKGHTLIEEAPKVIEEAEEIAYRARPVGQKGISAGERPVATSSLEKARTYKENLESMTGQPHEVVQTSVKSGGHNKHAGPDGDTWFSFKKEIPEESVKVHESRSQSEQTKERLPKVKDLRVPAERDTPGHNETIKQGGAIPGGIQKGDPEINLPDLALFHDPATGSTLALPTDKMSAKAVKEQIQKSRQMYLDAEDRAKPKVLPMPARVPASATRGLAQP